MDEFFVLILWLRLGLVFDLALLSILTLKFVDWLLTEIGLAEYRVFSFIDHGQP